MSISLVQLPIELIYRILGHLPMTHMIVSARNVCSTLNTIIDTYHPYQVINHSANVHFVSMRPIIFQKCIKFTCTAKCMGPLPFDHVLYSAFSTDVSGFFSDVR